MTDSPPDRLCKHFNLTSTMRPTADDEQVQACMFNRLRTKFYPKHDSAFELDTLLSWFCQGSPPPYQSRFCSRSPVMDILQGSSSGDGIILTSDNCNDISTESIIAPSGRVPPHHPLTFGIGGALRKSLVDGATTDEIGQAILAPLHSR